MKTISLIQMPQWKPPHKLPTPSANVETPREAFPIIEGVALLAPTFPEPHIRHAPISMLTTFLPCMK